MSGEQHAGTAPADNHAGNADDVPFDCDVAIVGGGPVGLALAGWLARRGGTRTLSVALIDASERDKGDRPADRPLDKAEQSGQPANRSEASTDRRNPRADPRFIALSHGSRVLLESIPGLRWPRDATPIERIHVSQRGHFGRATIERGDHGVPALGYVVRYGALIDALRHALEATLARHGACVEKMNGIEALPAVQHGHGVSVPLRPVGQTGAPTRTLRARLLINAEGGLYARSADASNTLAETMTRDYGQTAIIGTVCVATAQPNVAWERFTSEGPIALLPIGTPGSGGSRRSQALPQEGRRPERDGFDYALVWCCRPESARRRMALPDAAFLDELGATFGTRMGRFTRIGARAEFPLGLKARHVLVEGRIAAIGNAAQTLHPVAGQGLNLGLRDAHSLVDALARHGATSAALATFAHRRRIDRALTIGVTDLLARGFAIDFAPLATLRGAALAALEFAPPLKSALARHMMFGHRH